MQDDDQARVAFRGSPTRCPYCHADCFPASKNVVCRDCLARHHPDCWAETGRCSSCSSTIRMLAVEDASETSQPRDSQGRRRGWVTSGALLIVSVVIAYVALGNRSLTIHGYLEALGFVAAATACLGLASGWTSRSYRWGIATALATVGAGFLGSLPHLSSWRASIAFLGGGFLVAALPALLATWARRRLHARAARTTPPLPAGEEAAEPEAPSAGSDPEPALAARAKREKA